MDKLLKLKSAYQDCLTKMQAILDSTDASLSDEQQAQFDALDTQAKGLKKQIENYENLLKEKAEADRIANAPVSLGRQVPASVPAPNTPQANRSEVLTVPAQARRWSGRLTSFKGDDAELRAYKAGMWLAASLTGNAFAKKFCAQHGLMTNKIELDSSYAEALHQEGVNSTGGYLVYPEYERDIIRLVETYGLARQKLNVVPMISDTKTKPRRTGGITAYFVGEAGQITASTGSWDNVKLVAKKLAAITTASNELASDAIISIADAITQEIALAFATKEDLCAFQGDGTSTYGGIFGVVKKLSALNGVDDGGGLVLGTGNAYSELTDGDFMAMLGRLPNYAGIRPEWYCSKAFWAAVMVRLIRAAGGATMAEFEGAMRPQYAGYPVNWTSGTTAMPVAEANSQICCLFGDMRMAAMFGDRQGIAIATSTDATVGSTNMFDTDSFAIRGVERFDINVHDVGTASVAGPVVGLITKAS